MNVSAIAVLRQAVLADLPSLMKILNLVIPIMQASGNFQWDEKYPNCDVLSNDIKLNQLWVAVIDDRIAAFGALTEDQSPEYADCGWDLSTPAIVPHRLATHPEWQRSGIASLFLSKAADLAKDRGYKCVRIDTNKKNEAMQALLGDKGFDFCGEITLLGKPPGMRYLCFEKIIGETDEGFQTVKSRKVKKKSAEPIYTDGAATLKGRSNEDAKNKSYDSIVGKSASSRSAFAKGLASGHKKPVLVISQRKDVGLIDEIKAVIEGNKIGVAVETTSESHALPPSVDGSSADDVLKVEGIARGIRAVAGAASSSPTAVTGHKRLPSTPAAIDASSVSIAPVRDTSSSAAVVALRLVKLCELCQEREGKSAGVEDTRMSAVSRGFINTGNSCYRNVVMQALLAVESFSRVLFSILSELGHVRLSIPDAPSWEQLLALLKALMMPSSEALALDDHISPLVHRFLKTLSSTSSSSSPAAVSSSAAGVPRNVSPPLRPRQQDAMEFLTFVLDSLHEEMAAVCTSASFTTVSSVGDALSVVGLSDRGSASENDGDEWETVSKGRMKEVVDQKSKMESKALNMKSFVSRLFHGTLRSEVHYPSKRVSSSTFQRFHCLCLQVKDVMQRDSGGGGGNNFCRRKLSGSTAGTLDEALALYFQKEDVGGSGGRSSRVTSKSVLIDLLPPVLVLQLNRFTYDVEQDAPIKVTRAVTYTSELSVPVEFMTRELRERIASDSSSDTGSVKYRLVSVISHHGDTASSGHYTCATVTAVSVGGGRARQWRCYDDASVRVISEAEALGSANDAYIFFYARINRSRRML